MKNEKLGIRNEKVWNGFQVCISLRLSALAINKDSTT